MPDTDKKIIGLAMSGGGYRAAAFHLGTLRALYDLQIFDKVSIMSTISGGSITGAAYSLKETDYPTFEKQMIDTLTQKSVIRHVLFSFMFLKTLLFLLFFIGASIYVLFTDYAWASPVLLVVMIVLLMLFQYKNFPVSKQIEKAYDKFLLKINHFLL